MRSTVSVAATDLLVVPEGMITEAGLRTNIRVGIQYLESWLRGQGCVPINHLMEDAATAEISRAQVWQWIRHPRGILNDGRKVTVELFRALMAEELARIEQALGAEEYARRAFVPASELFDSITTSDEFVDFLTIPAYQRLG